MARAYGGLALAVCSLRADVCSPCSVACLCVMPLPLSPSPQGRKRQSPARKQAQCGCSAMRGVALFPSLSGCLSAIGCLLLGAIPPSFLFCQLRRMTGMLFPAFVV